MKFPQGYHRAHARLFINCQSFVYDVMTGDLFSAIYQSPSYETGNLL